ncbi:myosin-3-like [Teleopsis dalmanni]|uniref:myosin-3-like n=1 Tax=Teleopsis dalmanni TaxID=139649 RepID=UPI0018CC7D63|nr:myosin-3-like [Teleopsis dalmanni]
MEFLSNYRFMMEPHTRDFPNNFTRLRSREDYGITVENQVFNDGSPPNDNILLINNCYYETLSRKVLMALILGAWRRSREEIKSLLNAIIEFKKGTLKSRNKLHVYCSLFRVEQKRNEELTLQIKRSMETIHQTRVSYDNLSVCVAKLKADKKILEQKLVRKTKEMDTLQNLYSKTKTDMFRTVMQLRSLEDEVENEKRSKLLIDDQKNKLIKEVSSSISEINAECRSTEAKYQAIITKQDEQLDEACKRIRALEMELKEKKEKDEKLQEFSSSNAQLQAQLSESREEVSTLKKTIEDSITTKLRSCWNTVWYHQKYAFNLVHLFAYYLLPATPPPRFKFVHE